MITATRKLFLLHLVANALVVQARFVVAETTDVEPGAAHWFAKL